MGIHKRRQGAAPAGGKEWDVCFAGKGGWMMKKMIPDKERFCKTRSGEIHWHMDAAFYLMGGLKPLGHQCFQKETPDKGHERRER